MNACTSVVEADGDSTSALTDDDIKRMRVAELRVELSQRGLDAKGLKATLKERLDEAIMMERGIERVSVQ